MHYNGGNSCLFVNDTKIIKFRAKDSEIMATPLCLGNMPKDFSIETIKKTELNKCVYETFIILDIHKYLMKKNNII